MTNRREFLAGGTALIGASFITGSTSSAFGQDKQLSIFSHKVHQTVSEGAQGGNIISAWAAENGVRLQWTTMDTAPLQDRLFREASLARSGIDVGFIVNTHVIPRIKDLFEPLDDLYTSGAIEAPEDLFSSLVNGLTVGGTRIGVPFRHATSGLHYNEAILAERGFNAPPSTIEDFFKMAKECTYSRADGTACVGFVLPGMAYPNVIDVARAWNGDFITEDFRVLANEPAMVNAVSAIKDLYDAGAFPRNFTTITPEDVNTWMQQGRAAFSAVSMSRNKLFNDPEKSLFPDKIKTIAMPASSSLAGQFSVAPAKVEFWGMVVPKTSQNKDLAKSFISAMSSKEATVKAALNGNGPVRKSAYENTDFRSRIPYGDAERAVLEAGRVPLPAFDQAAKAADIFKEEAELAVLGNKSVQAAMDAVVERVTPLLPQRR